MSGWSPSDLLPALWLVVVGFSIDRAARRWARPIPLLVWATAGALVLVLFAPALLLGQVLASLQKLAAVPPFQALPAAAGPGNPLHGDLVLQVIPWQAAVRRFLAAGEWPLWNPWTGAGSPLLANLSAQVLQPLVWLALPLPLAASLGVLAALRVLVALLSTFLLLRHQGAGRTASLFGAVAYGLGGFLVLYVGWPLANAAALLPLAAYATVRWMGERDRVSWVLLALSMAAVLATGHPDTTLWVLVATGLFTLAGRSALRRPADGATRWLLGLGAWVLAVTAAAALSAPMLIPALLGIPESHRFATTEGRLQRIERNLSDLGKEGATGLSAELAEGGRRLLPVAAPNAFGNQRFGPQWGEERNTNQGSGGFAGSAALLAALAAGLGLLSGRATVIAGERLAAVLVLLSAVLVAQPPGVLALLAHVPGLEHSANFHRRSHIVLVFGLAFLAAAVVERWRRGTFRRGPIVGLAAGLAILVTWGYLAHPDPRAPGVLSHLGYGSLALHLGVLAVAGVTLASRRLGRSRHAAVLLVGVQAIELLVLHAPANPTAPAAHFYPRLPPLDFLAEHAGGDRIVGLDPVLRANVATVYGLADVRTNDPGKPWAMQRLLEPVMPPGPNGRFGIADRVVVADHPVLDLLGVRYVLAASSLRAPPALAHSFTGAKVSVWARPHPLGRLFLPEAATTLAAAQGPGGPRAIGPWWRWTARNADFAVRTLVEATPGHEGRWRARRPSGAVLEVTPQSVDRWRARALLPEERLLASGIYQDGGWRLLVDGRAAATVKTNGTLVGAWLPAGEHELELVYRPPGFVAGCLLAAAALAVLIAVGARPPHERVRAPNGAPGTEPARFPACS
jgi:hypothetical protein